MKLLNSKNILDCSEDEIDIHNNEIKSIIENIKSIGDYECAILAKYQDIAHIHIEQEIIGSSLKDIDEIIERFDIKNGIDIYQSNDGYYVLLLHGMGYEFEGDYHLIQVALKIMPYDKNRNFINNMN